MWFALVFQIKISMGISALPFNFISVQDMRLFLILKFKTLTLVAYIYTKRVIYPESHERFPLESRSSQRW